MIPASKIAEINNAARVEEVVGEYVNLKKRGSNLIGICPFHDEKTPSFSVSPAKGIYKCFGCGKAGNPVNFIMDIEQLGYIDALKFLAEKYRIEWPKQEQTPEQITEEKRRQDERERLQIVNNFAERYFEDVLWNDDEGKLIGLSYFEERGFRPETIKKFKLGFAKDSWDHFTNAATGAGHNLELLINGGLVKRNDENNKTYDAYRNRVMFTIHSISGKPIAFAGRYLVKDVKSPKYVNSPETVLYHKSNELYGLFFAKQSISKNNLVYLVEGYTDVITLHQAGIENVVASSGTSLTEGQIKLLKRFTENVCVLYDGDAAGIKASLRGTDMLLEAGLNVKIVLFPDGEDPDSYCQKVGGEQFGNYLSDAKQDFVLFKTNLLMQDVGNDPVKRAECIKEVVNSISKIPDVFKRSVFLHEAAKILNTDEQLLINEANKNVRDNNKKQPVDQQQLATINRLEAQEQLLNVAEELKNNDIQEKDLLRVLLNYGSKPYNENFTTVASYIFHELNAEDVILTHPIVSKVINEILEKLQDPLYEISTADFINHSDPLVTALVADVLAAEPEISPNWSKKIDEIIEPIGHNYKQDVDSCLIRLQLRNIDRLIEENRKVIADEEQNGNIDQVEIHTEVHMHLIKKRADLAHKTLTTILK